MLISSYVDEGTMIDTWASVGSCAQVGKNCHVSEVRNRWVLEPLQAGPVIIEDNCFIGARSEIAEGVIVEEELLFQWVFTWLQLKLLIGVRKYNLEKFLHTQW